MGMVDIIQKQEPWTPRPLIEHQVAKWEEESKAAARERDAAFARRVRLALGYTAETRIDGPFLEAQAWRS